MNELTREEVLHVAHLARINLSEEEIPVYQKNLKIMIDEIDKIRDIEDYDEDYIISPCDNKCSLEKENINVDKDNLLNNVPHKKGNFIEVPVVVNE